LQTLAVVFDPPSTRRRWQLGIAEFNRDFVERYAEFIGRGKCNHRKGPGADIIRRSLHSYRTLRRQGDPCRCGTIDQHGAGPALTVIAALLRAGQFEILAQWVEQSRARIDH
jgi:hypothetical protein